MAKRRSRKGANKIQYVPTDRFVKVSLDGLAVTGKKVFVAWRNDIHNGLPEDAYIIVPQSLSKHIVLSLKDNGCGWIEANLVKDRTVEFKMRFNVSLYYPDEKEAKGVVVRFQLFEPKNKEPVLESELDVFLQCNKSMNKALKGSFDAISSSLSLSASNATAPKEEFLYDNFRRSCDGTNITITPAPIFKFEAMNENLHGKRKHDFGDDSIGKKLRIEHENLPFPCNEQTEQPSRIEIKDPLRISVSMDINRWLEPIQDFDQTSRLNTSFLEASCQLLPYPCSLPDL